VSLWVKTGPPRPSCRGEESRCSPTTPGEAEGRADCRAKVGKTSLRRCVVSCRTETEEAGQTCRSRCLKEKAARHCRGCAPACARDADRRRPRSQSAVRRGGGAAASVGHAPKGNAASIAARRAAASGGRCAAWALHHKSTGCRSGGWCAPTVG
jgi:hypothetical protein